MQPIVKDERGVYRFKSNQIVSFLLDHGNWGLGSLSMMNFSAEDWAQFYQLIGYSVSGYGDCELVGREYVEEADRVVESFRG